MSDLSPRQQAVLDALLDPALHDGEAPKRIETHGAIVLLGPARVLKMKKAVLFPFLDFSTEEKRQAAIEAEYTLNRRTAPDLYLGVRPVLQAPGGALRLSAAGEAPGPGETQVETVLEMRRFPTDALLAHDPAALTAAQMRSLADAIAALHGQAETVRDAARFRSPEWICEDNLDSMAAAPGLFAPPRLAAHAAATRSALQRTAPLRAARLEAGCVRHCHGDLHLENIVFWNGEPTPFDCLEFDPRLAISDVSYDTAYALMDLSARGRGDLANALQNRWLERTEDYGSMALLPLWVATRAQIRAKIAAAMLPEAVRLGQRPAQGPDEVEHAERAERFMALAERLLAPQPAAQLICVGGLSGTGKSTVSGALAPGLGGAAGAVILRTDTMRKRMLGVADSDRLPPAAYADDVTERVFRAVERQAAAALAAGISVIVDSTCALDTFRERMERVANDARAPFRGLWLELPDAQRLGRVERRTGDASDATVAVAQGQSLVGTLGGRWARVDAGGGPQQTVQNAAAALADRQRPNAPPPLAPRPA